jgi:hypothetical protein
MLTKSDLIKELIYRDVYDLDIIDIEDIYQCFRMLFIDGFTYAEAADVLAVRIASGEFGMTQAKSRETEAFF